MSTTDTGAAFEAWAITEGLISDSHGIRFVNSMCEVARKAFNAGIAHTEAAKATGTAQTKQSFENIEELPLPETNYNGYSDGSEPLYTTEMMRAYGQACAEAARSLAISQADYNRDMDELAQDFEPVANMDLLKAKLHIVGLRKRLKNAKAKAEAARQPAPVVAVKTWQERVREKFPETEDRNLFALGHLEHAMEAEIADLRAALAKTNTMTELDDSRIKMISYGHRIGSEVAVKFARAILDAATNAAIQARKDGHG